ncbi:MAG: helix-turn-helix transcriptional regulator [Opitutae bacterium]|nr:helix-turn-helix transcriptional regulator [Opitutae bacterium]
MPTPRPGPMPFTPAAIMADSKLFQDYRRAFALACGLVPELRHPDSSTWNAWSANRVKPSGARLAGGRRSCAARLFFRQRPANAVQPAAPAPECHAERGETVVPVRNGHRVIALLQLGQAPLRAPARDEMGRVLRLTGLATGLAEAEQAETALRQARDISPAQYASLVQLLEIFSRQLADWFAQHAPAGRAPEPPALLRAKEWIEAHYHEPLTLTEVAKVAQMSPSHFCRSFHGATGLKFREFLSRTRLTRARQLLADPRNAVAETALAAGFQSLSQFNRTFRQLAGQSPSEYRAASVQAAPRQAKERLMAGVNRAAGAGPHPA